ncbi:MAG: hypothetical protein GY940_07165 [bacterium]|nr:hypothetical protein [bacterium]
MVITNKMIETYLEQTRITLDSLYGDTFIKTRILEFGYTDERLTEGITLRGEVSTLYNDLLTSRGNQAKMSFSLNEKYEKASFKFSFYAGLFKTAFHDTPELVKEMGLEGRRKRTVSTFLAQANNVYTNVVTKPHILDRLSGYSITAERMQEELDVIAQLKILHMDHSKAQGECQRITETRDEKLAELRRYMRQLRRVLFMLFKDNNIQILERINVFVRNRRKPRTRKVTEEPSTETPEEPAPQPEPGPATTEPATEEPANTGTEPPVTQS